MSKDTKDDSFRKARIFAHSSTSELLEAASADPTSDEAPIRLKGLVQIASLSCKNAMCSLLEWGYNKFAMNDEISSKTLKNQINEA